MVGGVEVCLCRSYLVYESVLKALGLWHKLLGAAIPVAGRSGVPNQIPVIDLKDHRLDEACTASDCLSH